MSQKVLETTINKPKALSGWVAWPTSRDADGWTVYQSVLQFCFFPDYIERYGYLKKYPINFHLGYHFWRCRGSEKNITNERGFFLFILKVHFQKPSYERGLLVKITILWSFGFSFAQLRFNDLDRNMSYYFHVYSGNSPSWAASNAPFWTDRWLFGRVGRDHNERSTFLKLAYINKDARLPDKYLI